MFDPQTLVRFLLGLSSSYEMKTLYVFENNRYLLTGILKIELNQKVREETQRLYYNKIKLSNMS